MKHVITYSITIDLFLKCDSFIWVFDHMILQVSLYPEKFEKVLSCFWARLHSSVFKIEN